jgi:hypothetical protein
LSYLRGRQAFSLANARPFLCNKTVGRDTNQSIMMLEKTLPAGTASFFHLHPDSDKVAWVRAGELTFMIGRHSHGWRVRHLPIHTRATFRMPERTLAEKPAASCLSTHPCRRGPH